MERALDNVIRGNVPPFGYLCMGYVYWIWKKGMLGCSYHPAIDCKDCICNEKGDGKYNPRTNELYKDGEWKEFERKENGDKRTQKESPGRDEGGSEQSGWIHRPVG